MVKGSPPADILGRSEERGQIDRLLKGARRGRSAALVLTGEPGIGKTLLLRYAEDRAGGMTVLSARGFESESDLAFLGLGDLLRPLLDYRADIPQPQAQALSGALGLEPGTPGERFAVSAATLSLLGAGAEARPILGLVDDAHWLDGPSAQAITFAARRLDAEGVVLLFAAREGEERAFEPAGIPQYRLTGLDREAGTALLTAGAGGQLPPDLVDRLLDATAGNPLALKELPGVVSAAQLMGTEPLTEPLPVSSAIAQAFQRRVARLPEESRAALLVAAACDGADMAPIVRVLERMGRTARDLEPAEHAGLVTITRGGFEFQHPLLRSTIYQEAAAADRREAHRLFGAVLEDVPERRAWHLAAAALDPSEEVAVAMEDVARASRRRGGHAAAATAFETAARLSPDEEDRARRRFEAGLDAQMAASSHWAARLLESALSEATDPLLRADIQSLLGATERFRTSPERAAELFESGASEVERHDPGRATMMLMEAALSYNAAGGIPRAVAVARKAAEAAEGSPGFVGPLTMTMLETLSMQLGEAPPDLTRLGVQLRALLDTPELPPVAHVTMQFGLLGTVWAGQFEEARQVLIPMIGTARDAAAIGALPLLLSVLAELEIRTGHWRAAYAAISESVRLAGETGQSAVRSWALTSMARIEAGQGREEECRDHVAESITLAREHGVGPSIPTARSALGLLELGLGRPEEAAEVLEVVARELEELGQHYPPVVPFAPDFVEAHYRAGQTEQAEHMLADLEGRAERTDCTWARAAAARCRGLVATDEFEHHFSRALGWHEPLPMPFELARTELCFGQRLRRAGRRQDARPHLRSALATFEQLDAEPWADQARGEISGSVERARKRTTIRSDELTPQELQIALQVAEGRTNKAVAAALFLSPKTVEAHLSHIYRKLGLRSRTELARHMARQASTLN